VSDAPHDSYAALRLPDYRRFMAYTGLFTLALSMQGVVVGWQVYDLSHDPLALGLVGLAEALPFLSSALFGGYAADRVNRKAINAVSTACLLLCALALGAFSLLVRRGTLPPLLGPIYGVIALTGLARAFQRPAATALGTELLPRELYANGSSWRTAIFQTGSVTGPVLGGFLYAWRGPVASYAVVALLMLASLVLVLRIEYAPAPQKGAPVPILQSLGEGLRFVRGQRLLLGAMGLDLFAVLFGGAVALLPAFAHDVLSLGPGGLGLLRAAPALGSVAMGLVMTRHPLMRNAGRTLLSAVAAFGLCWILFALSRVVALSLVLLLCSGALDTVSMVLRATLLQSLTPGHMLGRVSAVNQLFIGSSNEIGAFESGLAAKLLGLVPSVIFGGCMTFLVVAGISWKVPQLRKLQRITG